MATFYALLSTEFRPPRVAHVCDDIACQLAGAENLCRKLEEKLGPEGAAWFRSPCLGQCERAPAALLQLAGEDDWTLTSADAEAVAEAVSGTRSESRLPSAAPQTVSPRAEGLRILRRIGRASPSSLDDYREQGGYRALRRAFEIGPEGVLREVKESGVRGRGGAAFPMGVKWEAVAKAPGRPHYVVCNADESEPGTFKDRALMEEDPFAVIEATTIAGFATGATRGYIYVRGEYPLAIRRLRHAIETSEKRGFLGAGIMPHCGEEFDFAIEVRQGAGAYICGEETALFNSIEGFRGEPRSKPPFPTQVGLFRKPTVVNNVETLVNVLDIVLDGGAEFAAIGTKESAGPKLFCVSGHVARPGVYEVAFGATLRAVIDLAGGVPGGRKIKTILLGGAAGSFVGPEEIDTPLTFEGTRAIGATLGSGVIMVFDETADLRATAARIARFFRDESCGQCVPCRVGTVRQEESLSRLARNGDERAGESPSRRARAGHARCLDLRPRADGGERHRFGAVERDPHPGDTMSERRIDITLDGESVSVPEGATLLDACRDKGIDTPTLCYLENLTPVNACRVCVVELEGSRVLVPACSRKAEAGMKVATDTARVRHSRKLVLELLASSVDLSLASAEIRSLHGALRGRPREVRAEELRPPKRASATPAIRATITSPTGAARRRWLSR